MWLPVTFQNISTFTLCESQSSLKDLKAQQIKDFYTFILPVLCCTHKGWKQIGKPCSEKSDQNFMTDRFLTAIYERLWVFENDTPKDVLGVSIVW